MTKLIGVMCVRDEADLLPEVYPHIKELVDEIYVYDDGSTDDTWGLVKDADYAIRREDDTNRLSIPRPNYHHLLEKIKENHDIEEEDVWAIITMGDRFFRYRGSSWISCGTAGTLGRKRMMGSQTTHRAYVSFVERCG